jgi:trimethylamine--corrinoid protein Co-methyltransferase
LDRFSDQYRPSTLNDLYDFTRLVDQLPNVSWFTRCCVATDIEDIYELDVNTAYALLRGTKKPVATSFTLAKNVDPIVDMFDIVLGGPGKFADRPFCKAHISPIISPLKYGEDAVMVALACMKRGVPISNIVATMSGATAPGPLAGVLSISLAETLAALVMTNIFEPGYPMIFSNWPFVIDLRTGAFRGGSGEMALLNAASAQLSNALGLPSGCASSMTDAKSPDAQMGMEKALTSLACGLAGGNMVYESSGMMASLLGVSFEAFVMDDEMLSLVHRIIRGFEINQQTLEYDSIESVVSGEGHFIGQPETMRSMERDYYYPKIADREEPAVWQDQGALDHLSRAKHRVNELLNYHPDYLESGVDEAIRKAYPIILEPRPS